VKKLLVAFFLGVALVCVGFIVLKGALTRAAHRQWPAGLGPIASVPERFPRTTANRSALELNRLAAGVAIDFMSPTAPEPDLDEIAGYVRAQLQRPDADIDEPPARVRAFLNSRRSAIDAVRAHLLAAEAPRWDIDLSDGRPAPRFVAHVHLHRLFVARALDRARSGDAGAWDDLHAAWKAAQPLNARPEVISALIHLSLLRGVNTAARKMPFPAPPWFEEIRSFDARRAMLAAMQSESWIISRSMEASSAHRPGGPLFRFVVPMFVSSMRESSTHLYGVSDCAFDVEAYVKAPWWDALAQGDIGNIQAGWARVYRFELERELTERAFALRGGITPSTGSRCEGGQWIVSPDGLKFNRRIPPPGPPAAALPLEFRP
jgi:hypothetical protein